MTSVGCGNTKSSVAILLHLGGIAPNVDITVILVKFNDSDSLDTIYGAKHSY